MKIVLSRFDDDAENMPLQDQVIFTGQSAAGSRDQVEERVLYWIRNFDWPGTRITVEFIEE